MEILIKKNKKKIGHLVLEFGARVLFMVPESIKLKYST